MDSINYDTFLINNGANTIEAFNYSTSLAIWFDSYANMINGTDGTLWHPNATQDERIYAFYPEICRSIYLTFNETQSNICGIDLYRYTLPNTIYSNSTENQGFCINGTQCLLSGLFTQIPCQKCESIIYCFLKWMLHHNYVYLVSELFVPYPKIASNPHFLDADPIVLNAVEGLYPNDTLHRSFVDIEPTTGSKNII
jgi:hypothetical protein